VEKANWRLDDDHQSGTAVACLRLQLAAHSQTEPMLSRRRFSQLLPGALVATGSLAGCASRDGEAASGCGKTGLLRLCGAAKRA
jgi:hypothetical protein